MANFSLLAKIGLDSKAFQKGLKQSEQSTKKFGKSITSTFAKVAVALGGAALAKNMVRLGMDAEEVADKFNTVLGPSASKVNDEITKLLKTIPATRAELQDSIATVTQMGMAFGMSDEAAGKFALGMTKISADLASFHNMNPEEVFLKMQAAITGEFEPLKRLGIVINEARLKQEAFNLGIGDGKSSLDAQAKAIAVQNIVLKDMGAALGNAAQTQDSSANRTKFFKAQITELQTEIGTKMIPVFAAFLKVIAPFVTFISANIEATVKFTRRILAFAAGLKIAAFLLPLVSKGVIAYSAAAKTGAAATFILSSSLRRLALAIKGLLASTGVGLLVVALSEVAMMAIHASQKTGQATDGMTGELDGLQKEIEATMDLVNESTESFKEGAEAQEEYAEGSKGAAEQLKKEKEAHEELARSIKSYFEKVKEAKRAEEDRFIQMKEFESLKLRAAGDHKAADALDEQIEKTKEAIAISRKHGISLKQAAKLAQGVDENKEGDTGEEKKAKKLEALAKKINEMKLEALRAQARGDKEAQASMEKRVELAEKIVNIMGEFNVSQEEATALANKTGDAVEDAAEEQKKSSLTGHNLKKASNIAGEEDGIRFEKLGGGGFQQFVNGKKGRKFTEAEMQAGLQKKIDKDPSEALLEKINSTLEGKFVSQ